MKSYRFVRFLSNFGVYFVLTFFAFVMLFPFLYMLSTSFKIPADTFRYPPRMLPRDPVTIQVEGYEEPLPLYFVEVDGVSKEYALAKSNIKVGVYAPADDQSNTVERFISEVKPTGGVMNQQKVTINGEEVKLFDVEVNGQVVPMILVTHDPMDAVVLAARTLVLREGHVEQQGTTAEVLGHPRSQFVAAMAGVNLVAGVAEADGALRCADGLRWVGRGEHVPTGEAATCVFAPGSVRIHPAAGPSEASAANSWSGVVAVMDPVPGGIRLFTAEYPRLAIECPSTTALALGIRPGVELAFSIDVDDISVRRSR